MIEINRTDEEPCMVRVMNTAGQVVMENRRAGDMLKLDLTGLSAGIYIVQVQTGLQSGIQRLIIR